MEISNFGLVVIAVVLIIEAIALYYAIKYSRLRKLIYTTDTTRISDLSEGFYEIKGLVTALSEPFISPYSEKNCVYYKFQVEEKNNNKDYWADLIHDEKMQRFGVQDGSGVAVVDLKYADLILKNPEGENPEFQNMSYSNRERLLKRYEVKSINGNYERTVRYKEQLIEVGAQIFVLGEVHGEDNGKPLFKVQGKPLIVSNHAQHELSELYRNKSIWAFTVMISVPLGLFLYWLFERI